MSRRLRKRHGTSKAQAHSGKATYSDWSSAKAQAELYMERHPWSLPKKPYRCPYCRKFHYGSPVGRR